MNYNIKESLLSRSSVKLGVCLGSIVLLNTGCVTLDRYKSNYLELKHQIKDYGQHNIRQMPGVYEEAKKLPRALIGF